MLNRFGVEIDFEKSWDEGVKGIRNCQLKFECNKKWNDLQALEGQQNVRFCTHCLKEVHYIDDAWDLALALDKDWCVAVTRTLAITAKAVKNLNEPLMGSLVSVNLGRKE
ncbi:MAG: hypothetical protein RIQ55_987 [Pseudomonadota bacterium]|jgi:hypothetical protein